MIYERHPEEPVTLGEMRALVEILAHQIASLRAEVQDLRSKTQYHEDPPNRKDR